MANLAHPKPLPDWFVKLTIAIGAFSPRLFWRAVQVGETLWPRDN